MASFLTQGGSRKYVVDAVSTWSSFVKTIGYSFFFPINLLFQIYAARIQCCETESCEILEARRRDQK